MRTRWVLPALLVLAATACATAPPATPRAILPAAAPTPSVPITVHAACGVREVFALGAAWDAAPPYVTVVLPPGVSSPYVAPRPGTTSADPGFVEQVPARFTMLGPDRARVDSPRLAAPVMLTRLPAGAPPTVCRP